MDGFPSGQRGQTVNLLQFASVVRIHLHPFSFSGIFLKRKTYHIQHNIAGWSSLEARRAHNPKVIGSNPIPATQCESICAQLAQLVEHLTFNQVVGGSNPPCLTEEDKRKAKKQRLPAFFASC